MDRRSGRHGLAKDAREGAIQRRREDLSALVDRGAKRRFRIVEPLSQARAMRLVAGHEECHLARLSFRLPHAGLLAWSADAELLQAIPSLLDVTGDDRQAMLEMSPAGSRRTADIGQA